MGKEIENSYKNNPDVISVVDEIVDKFALNEVKLLLLGFKMIGEPQDHYTSFRKNILGRFELAWYREDKFLRFQTIDSGFTIRLEHITTIQQLVQFVELLTGQEYSIK